MWNARAWKIESGEIECEKLGREWINDLRGERESRLSG